MKKKYLFDVVCGSVVLIAVATTLSAKAAKRLTTKHIDPLVSHIDYNVRPQDDFFEYANGKWFKHHPIPASEQNNGIFQLIQDTINAQVLDICKSAASKEAQPGSNKQKIGDFYFSGMDSVSLNKNGINDLKDDLAKIDDIKDLNDIASETSYIHKISSSPLFSFYVTQDDKNSSKYQVYVAQGGLSMPDRNFYVDMDEKSKEIRNKFVSYATDLYVIMGYDRDKAQQSAAKLLEMETALANVSRKREDTRDPFANYNKMSTDSLRALAPNFNWTLFMQGIGLTKVDSVVVGQPEFLTGLNDFLNKYTINEWKNYLKFHYLNGLAPFVDDNTYKKYFSFYSTTLRGVKEARPRWKRVVTMTDDALGDLIGQVYVDEYLPKGTKEKLLEIGKAIQTEFAQRIKALDWMSEATKQKALHKLNAVIMKMGYPDKWKNMSNLNIDRSSYVKNVMNVNKWETAFMINKYGKPVDRTEWDMEPQTYNAYYNPSNNEIVIPGCNIIVPGYEKKMADDAILYAIIGGTIGHEITHGFDDQGCNYDANGNLANWWTKEDKNKFDAKTKLIVKQFNGYVAVDSLHINGALTQGENIADLGGVIMAYESFKKTEQYKKNIIIAGLNPSQRFFLGYAMAWMVNTRPEAIANQVKSNEHSPEKWRVIGPLSNMPEFYSTFGVKPGDKMWRSKDERVKIW
jgi:putative endopeptidase